HLTGTWMEAAEAAEPTTWSGQCAPRTDYPSCLDLLLGGPERITVDMDLCTRREAVLQSVAQLWTRGVDIDWDAFYASRRCGRMPLPSYPFERRRYWVDPPSALQTGASARSAKLLRTVEDAEGPHKAQALSDFLQREISKTLGGNGSKAA